jgi:dUTP pyrophosphatase
MLTHDRRVASPVVPGPVDAPRPEPITDPLDVLLTRLDPELPVPAAAHPADAGVDLRCTADVRLDPGERALVGTGVAIALPAGWAGFVHPRSGLAARTGLSIVNAPGTVDAGYRGEIRVCLVNLDPREPVQLRRGDRIAQLVVQRVERVRFVEVPELPASGRGAGGFGSTGGHARLAPVPAAPDPLESLPADPTALPGDPFAAGPLAEAVAGAVTADPVPSDQGGVQAGDRSADGSTRPGPMGADPARPGPAGRR